MDRYKRQAALLKAIGHPVRLQIVDLLRIEPECVCHLSAALDKPQPYMSQQLAILRNARVIVDERDGTNIYYRLADENVARQVTAACDDAHPIAEREVLPCCNCPKCSAARGQGGEAYRVAC
jgi:DNA-binding transcriptional ArsR family regulator